MTNCMLLSDRMSDVAAGRSGWTSEEERHLATCAECRAEWDLVRGAARLAREYRAPDPSATAAAVLQRLRTDRSTRDSGRRAWVPAVLATAAVAALLVWSGVGRGGPVRPPSPPRVAAAPATRPATAPAPAGSSVGDAGFPLPELDSLSTEALDSMLRVLDEPLARAAAWELPDLGDTGDQLLERAISGREG